MQYHTGLVHAYDAQHWGYFFYEFVAIGSTGQITGLIVRVFVVYVS
jgi:hypothetical protein